MMATGLYVLLGACCLLQTATAIPRRSRGPSVSDLREDNSVVVEESVPIQESRFVRSTQVPQGQTLLEDAMIGSVLRNQVAGARLVRTIPEGLVPKQTLLPMKFRLPDNYTLIRPVVDDSFRCEDKKYGYYADQYNECQLFHVCLNFQSIWPDNFTSPLTYQFSFICPKYTIFSQDSMTCAWAQEAVPCSEANKLYFLNDEFFKIPPEKSLIG